MAPPKVLVPVLLRIHPELRRRVAASKAWFGENRPARVIEEWLGGKEDELRERGRALIAIDVDALSIPEPCTPIFDEGLPKSFPAVCAIEPERAEIGENVVLFVRGLSGAPPGPRVFFGEIEAESVAVGPHRVVARVPEGALTAPVTMLVAGVRSLGRPFEVAAPIDRAYTILPPAPGEFTLGVPRLRPKNDDLVSVPLVVAGAADLGAYTTSMEYDPHRLRGVWVESGTAPFSSPPDPCIDNLIGRAMWTGRDVGPASRLLQTPDRGGRASRSPSAPSLLWLVDVRLATTWEGVEYPRIPSTRST